MKFISKAAGTKRIQMLWMWAEWKGRCCSFPVLYSDLLRAHQLNWISTWMWNPLGKSVSWQKWCWECYSFPSSIEPIPFQISKWEPVCHLSFLSYSLLILEIGKFSLISWQNVVVHQLKIIFCLGIVFFPVPKFWTVLLWQCWTTLFHDGWVKV